MFKLRAVVDGMPLVSEREYPIEDVAYAARRLGERYPSWVIEVVPAEEVVPRDVYGAAL